MSVEKHKCVESDSLLDCVHGKDTEAFLEELVQDEFLDWHLGDAKKDTTPKIKRESDDHPSETLTGIKNLGQKPIEDAKKTGHLGAKKETTTKIKRQGDNRKTSTKTLSQKPEQDTTKTAKREKSVPIKPSPTPQPQRKWTRFPSRLSSPHDTAPEPQTANATCMETDEVDSGSRDINKNSSSDPGLNVMDTMQENDWEDESHAKLGITNKTMERYLEGLWHDVKKGHPDMRTTRRSSTTSLDSIVSSSSSSSQDQGHDRKYLFACTEEELIDRKMRDVHKKFSENICDNWADDVELALMITKRQAKGRNIKNGEMKKLLNNILEQK